MSQARDFRCASLSGARYRGLPLTAEHLVRRLTAIFAADVAGYSRLTGMDEEGTHVRLKEHLRLLIDPRIAAHRGRIVKNTGDGLLTLLTRHAVHSMFRRGMEARNTDIPPDQRIPDRDQCR